jgi:L-ascorbate metabolism protein UlaG (beta-lactamase superfamily)
MPHRPNDTHGFLLRTPSAVVYFAGDTSLYDEMAELPDLAGAPVDVALMPIAGWGPRLSRGHMGPTDAAEACRLMNARAVVPIHHGTLHATGHHLIGLDWMHRPAEHFAQELSRLAPGCRLLDLNPGDHAELP